MKSLRRIALLGGAMLAASAAPAFAGDFDVTLEGFAAVIDTEADYINDDKPDDTLAGVMGGYRIGAEYTFGSTEGRGPFVGANYYATATDGIRSNASPNGNALYSESELEGLSGWEVLAGYDFGPFAIGAGYSKLEREVMAFQHCANDHEVYTASFCYASGNDVVGDQREGLRGGSPMDNSTEAWRLFGRWDVNETFAVSLSYLSAEFEQSTAPLAVIDNAENAGHPDRTAHPDTSLAQDFNGTIMIGGTIRLF